MASFGAEARDAVLECVADTDLGVRLVDTDGNTFPLETVAVDGDDAGGMLRIGAAPDSPPPAALEVYRLSTGEMVARFEA